MSKCRRNWKRLSWPSLTSCSLMLAHSVTAEEPCIKVKVKVKFAQIFIICFFFRWFLSLSASSSLTESSPLISLDPGFVLKKVPLWAFRLLPGEVIYYLKDVFDSWKQFSKSQVQLLTFGRTKVLIKNIKSVKKSVSRTQSQKWSLQIPQRVLSRCSLKCFVLGLGDLPKWPHL